MIVWFDLGGVGEKSLGSKLAWVCLELSCVGSCFAIVRWRKTMVSGNFCPFFFD